MGNKSVKPHPTFFAPTGEQTEIFNVRADLPHEDALELASMFLSNVIPFAAEEAESPVDYSILYQMEMAKELIDHARVTPRRPKRKPGPLPVELAVTAEGEVLRG